MTDDDLCVRLVPIFQGLSHEEQTRVAKFASPLKAQRGEALYIPGSPQSRLTVVHSGQLKVSHTAASGQEQVLRTVSVGEVVGERAFLTGHPSNDLVVALEDSQMCVFDHRDLSALLKEYPDIGQRMLITLSDRLASVERLLAAVTSSDVAARIAAYLLDLPAKFKDGTATVTLPIAKQEVASYLGTTPETLSRRLAALASKGVISQSGRRTITILDINALEQVAEAN